MEGNKLTEISENLFSSWTMLTEFNASKNLLNGIPDSIGGLSRLIRLDLHQNSELFDVIHIFLEVKQINMELECLHWC
nr:plant intracellular Ras-group-related LRR protein 6-like [Arachis hypogaea]